VIAGYAAVSAAALSFAGRPSGWGLLLLAHALMAGGALLAARLRPRATRGPLALLIDWYPLLLVPFLYAELDTLNQAVHGGIYFDDVIQRIEAALFGTQPSVRWSRVMPVLPLSELLHAAYLAYYPLIYLPPLLVYAAGRRIEFRVMVFALLLTFAVHYVFFIYFPVQGPRYLFAAPTGGLERGLVYGLAHSVLESGSSRGAAFPSSHVGVAVAQTLLIARFAPRLALPAAVVTVLLAAGAVYGGFHYAIDVLVGAALGAATCLSAMRWLPPADARARPEREPTP